MKTSMSLKEIAERHPEFVYEGKTYRRNAASGGWRYLDQRNEWKDVPKGWTRILRELPYMEDLEIKVRRDAEDARTEAQVKPMKVAIVGNAAMCSGQVMNLRTLSNPVVPLRTTLWLREFMPLGGKHPKKIGSKIEQRFERNTTKGSGRMGGTPEIRRNRRQSVRIAYRVIADARKRHIGLGYWAKRNPSFWRDAVRIIERAIKGDKFASWPMKTFEV